MIRGARVLGISAFFHDSAACLLRDGAIVAAAQEERFSRIKNDERFPARAAEYCLRAGGVGLHELDAVVFYEKPLLKLDRLVETYLWLAPRGLSSFLKAGPLWATSRLHVERAIRDGLGGFEGTVLFCEHHEAHAASAFYPSPFGQAAVLTIDGVGEWATASIGMGRGAELELQRELRFPDSLGLLYSAVTYHTGFKVNSGEYKVMGLAPYGEPRYTQRMLEHLIDLRDDGSFTLDQRYFDYLGGLTMTSAAFSSLFDGPPRAPESPITQRDMDLARSVQDVCEEVVRRMARHAVQLTGCRDLCLAGGVALNAVANGKVLRDGIARRLWIQPAAGDAGGAVGAALIAWHRYFGGARPGVDRATDDMHGALLGPGFSDAEISNELRALGANVIHLGYDGVVERTARELANGAVVGWFCDRAEFGPRALGARSILADARNPAAQSTLNLKIKFRESFRPFAPSVLAERAAEYFEIDTESPYMLLVAPVRESHRRGRDPDSAPRAGLDRLGEIRSDIPAATHVDYSARIQTVTEERAPGLHDVLSAFERLTGCPLVVNTSFNVRGEPIVCTPTDAYRCFMQTDMDVLAMPPFFLAKSDQAPWQSRPASRQLVSVAAYSASAGRRFSWTLGGAFAVLAVIAAWRGHSLGAAVLGAVAACFAAAGVLFPRGLGPVERRWRALGDALSRITTPIVFTMLYLVVLTPAGFLRRLRGSPLARSRTARTFWRERQLLERERAREAFEHLY